jgi:hypothetical protein
VAEPPFRRRVELHRTGPTTVTGEVEDHIHHFGLTVEHDAAVVVGVEGWARRAPWSPCPDAADELQELVGRTIGVLGQVPDPAKHCTHQLEVALATLRFAGGGLDHRRYDMTVSGWETGTSDARIVRDDGAELWWISEGRDLVAPEPFAGRSRAGGFAAWVLATFAPDEAEMALQLRRATGLAAGRGYDLDDYDLLADTPIQVGVCYATQPERITIARRNRGSSRLSG